MMNGLLHNVNFYLVVLDSLILIFALAMIFSVVLQRKQANLAVNSIDLTELRDVLHAHEQRMRAEYDRLIAGLETKIGVLNGHSSATDLKLSEIKNILVNMDGAIREIDFKEDAVSSGHPDDATYRFARKLLKEGQSIETIIQQTNLSRDEINILKNLLV